MLVAAGYSKNAKDAAVGSAYYRQQDEYRLAFSYKGDTGHALKNVTLELSLPIVFRKGQISLFWMALPLYPFFTISPFYQNIHSVGVGKQSLHCLL